MDWKNLPLMALVGALFGFVGAEISMSHAMTIPATVPMAAPVRDVTLRQAINTMLRQRNLTEAQKSAIAAINGRFTTQHNHAMANLMMAKAHLGDVFSESMMLDAPTKQAVSSMDDAVGDIQTQTINYIVDIRKVLTPIERHEFDDKVVAILMRDTP